MLFGRKYYTTAVPTFTDPMRWGQDGADGVKATQDLFYAYDNSTMWLPQVAQFPQHALWSTQTETNGRVVNPRPQAYKDTSADNRTGLSSFFAYGKRSAEADAYRQAHMTPGGTPGVLNLQLNDSVGRPCPYATFSWDGRQMLTDAKGQIKYVEKDYFQTAISLENERVKYVTQMISLVAGQPAENVIALFGFDFYKALAGCDDKDDQQGLFARWLYTHYLRGAGIAPEIAQRKLYVFERYCTAECSPEVMCNYGDNDPEWSRAFNKLCLLIEYHPSAILFDSGSLNPLESSGKIHGDSGHNNAGPLDAEAQGAKNLYDTATMEQKFPDSMKVTSFSGQASRTHRTP